jgi:hypothetical protein
MKITLTRKSLYEGSPQHPVDIAIPFPQLTKSQQTATLELLFKRLTSNTSH